MKANLTIMIMIICFGFLESAIAAIYFDDGLVHNIDWIIDDDVYVGLNGTLPPPPPELSSWNTAEITTLNLLPGGEINGRIVACTDKGIVNIEGGIVQGKLQTWTSGKAIMSDGIVYGRVSASGNSSIIISGGRIGGTIFTFSQATITIIGTDFVVDGVPIDYVLHPSLRSWSTFSTNGWYGVLTGTLVNGDPINNSYSIAANGIYDDSNIILEHIPEPMTIVLLGLGGLILTKIKYK